MALGSPAKNGIFDRSSVRHGRLKSANVRFHPVRTSLCVKGGKDPTLGSNAAEDVTCYPATPPSRLPP
jgi:hypothetical protein